MIAPPPTTQAPVIQCALKDARKWYRDHKHFTGWSGEFVTAATIRAYIGAKKPRWQELQTALARVPIQKPGKRSSRGGKKDRDVKNQITFAAEEVGDSDLESDADMAMSTFQLDQAMRGSATTIRGQQGNVKGGSLVAMAHHAISSQITATGGGVFTGQETTGLDIHSGADWTRHAGRMAITPTAIDALPPGNRDQREPRLQERAISTKDLTKPIHVGDEKTGHRVQYWSGNTERLFQSGQTGAGDEYEHILQKIELIKKANGLDDVRLAFMLKQRITTGSAPRLKQPDGMQENANAYLNTINTLLVGVESSRSNLAFVTGPMILDQIIARQMTFRQAFRDPRLNIGGTHYGGQYPMATNQSGRGSLARVRTTVQKDSKTGGSMRDARQHPQNAAVSLKSAITIKNFLIRRGLGQNPSKAQMGDAIKAYVQGLYPRYTLSQVMDTIQSKLSSGDWARFQAFLNGDTRDENHAVFNQVTDLLTEEEIAAFLNA